MIPRSLDPILSYNALIVTLGVTLLGIGAGVVGALALLRKRALMGDALAHATLPGVAGGFLLALALRLWLEPRGITLLPEPRSLLVLLIGAAVAALIGVNTVHLIRRTAGSRIPEEAAIGVVLSVFFGAGTVLLSVVQGLASSGRAGAGAAGLKTFIFGQPAAMSAADAALLGLVSLLAILCAFALFKEFRLITFDEGFARVQGWPVNLLDALMMALVVAVTVVGLQAVGLVLVVALLITPAAAARFWTDRLWLMLVIAGLLGGVSGLVGVTLSSRYAGLPAGALVVLVASALFLLSAIGAPDSGVIARILKRRALARKVRRDHALRAVYELLEHAGHDGHAMSASAVEEALRRIAPGALRDLRRAGIFTRADDGATILLTPAGAAAASAAARNHRLWEHYLVTRAALSTTHVDRAADRIEHVLDPELVAMLARELDAQDAALPSVHPIEQSGLGARVSGLG